MSLALALRNTRIRFSPALRDHVLVTLWFIVTFKQFRYDELLLYPLAAYFFWAFIRDFDQLFDLVMRSLILWAFPVWCVASMAWAVEPGMALRYSLQLILTVIICYTTVVRLTPRQIMLSVLIAAGWFGMLSFLDNPSGGVTARGVFKSKNSLGMAMVFLWVSAVCVMIEPRFPRWLRIGAGVLAALSLYLIETASSATAVLLAAGSAMAILGLRLFAALSTPALIASLSFFAAFLALVGAGVAFALPGADPVAYVLGSFGKDTTLTGRTDLWAYAKDEISQRPLLGVGTGGFWTAWDNLSLARRIYDEFYKSTRASFSFHNSYYEIAVHQGLIGLGLAGAAVVWALRRILPEAFTAQDIPSSFFVCIALVTLALSMTEVIIMVPFKLPFVLLAVGALLTLKQAPHRSPVKTPSRRTGPALGPAA